MLIMAGRAVNGRLSWCIKKWMTAQRQLSAVTAMPSHSNNGQPLLCHQMETRSLIRVSGTDTFPFLQGLITNDMELLEEGKRSMYSLMLNVQVSEP